MFSNLADAVAYRNEFSPVLVGSVTGSVSGTSSGTLERRRITHSAYTALLGKKVWAKFNNGGVMAQVEMSRSTFTLSRYPFKADLSSVTFDLYEPQWRTILFLPGYDELISANITLPSFTVFKALVPRTAQIRFTSTAYFVGSVSAQEFWFDGLRILGNFDNNNGGKILYFDPTAAASNNREHGNFGFFNCHIEGPHIDIVQWPLNSGSGVEGGLFVEFCKIRGHYDLFRCANNREIYIKNNEIYCYNDGLNDAEGCGVALGFLTNAKAAYPLKTWQVLDNWIDVITEGTYPAYGVKIGQSVGSGTAAQAFTDSRTIIRGNTIKVLSVGGTEEVAGISQLYDGADTDTPYIEVTHNSFDVRNEGSGAAKWAHSGKAGMPILRGGNNVINGTLGSNTTALTLA